MVLEVVSVVVEDGMWGFVKVLGVRPCGLVSV